MPEFHCQFLAAARAAGRLSVIPPPYMCDNPGTEEFDVMEVMSGEAAMFLVCAHHARQLADVAARYPNHRPHAGAGGAQTTSRAIW